MLYQLFLEGPNNTAIHKVFVAYWFKKCKLEGLDLG